MNPVNVFLLHSKTILALHPVTFVRNSRVGIETETTY